LAYPVPTRRIIAGFVWLWLMAVASATAHQQAPARTGSPLPLTSAGSLPVIKVAPNFALHSHADQPIQLSDLRGKVVLLDFFYASCPDICPVVTAKMGTLQRRLKQQGVLGRDVVLLSASFDPERDTPEALRRYAKMVRAEPGGWLFLRGADAEISRVVQGFDVWVKPSSDGSFDHSMRIYLIDRDGRIREIYNYTFFSVEQVLLDIRSLLQCRAK
jgi:protein SCO1/2